MKKNRFVHREGRGRARRCDWASNPRDTTEINPAMDPEDDDYDRIIKQEGIGKARERQVWMNRSFYRLLNKLLGKSEKFVEKAIKERIPDPMEYAKALSNIERAFKMEEEIYLKPCTERWHGNLEKLSEASSRGYSSGYYWDLQGILRRLPQRKPTRYEKSCFFKVIDDLFWYKHKDLFFYVRVCDIRYDHSRQDSSQWYYPNEVLRWENGHFSYKDLHGFNRSFSSTDIRQASKKEIEQNEHTLKLITANVVVKKPKI